MFPLWKDACPAPSIITTSDKKVLNLQRKIKIYFKKNFADEATFSTLKKNYTKSMKSIWCNYGN